MIQDLKEYLPTLKALLQYKNKAALDLLNTASVEFCLCGDNGSGYGMDEYTFSLKIPAARYYQLEQDNLIETLEQTISDAWRAILKNNDFLTVCRVSIVPFEMRENEIQSVSDNVWLAGYFRLFISHWHGNKNSAANLQIALRNFGIDSFVAHKDIRPSAEWEDEIEKALFSMQALCAIICEDFKKSDWCDQEVGVALGRNTLIIPINRGMNPYGFFGKYQALPSKTDAHIMAPDVAQTIYQSPKTHDLYCQILCTQLLYADTVESANKWIDLIQRFEPTIEKTHIEYIHKNLSQSRICPNQEVLEKLNQLFSRFALSPYSINGHPGTETVDDSLPF